MSENSRIRKRQALREVEGYLELLTSLEGQWELSPEVRNPVADRALEVLRNHQFTGAEHESALYLKGLALRVKELYTEAVGPLRESLNAEPHNLQAWLTLGWCFKRCDRLDLAIQALEEALTIYHNEPTLYYNLVKKAPAQVSRQSRDLDRVLKALRRD